MGVPVLDETVEHLETNDVVRELKQVVVHCQVARLHHVVESVCLNTVHVILPVIATTSIVKHSSLHLRLLALHKSVWTYVTRFLF